jgi:hypothetical protein
VYVFTRQGCSFTQETVLAPDDLQQGDSFGNLGHLALEGQTLAATGGGRAYVFEQSGGTWTQEAEIVPGTGDIPIVSIALQGDTLVLGAPGANGGTGAVFVFERRGGAWVQDAELVAGDAEDGDALGAFVSVEASTILASAVRKNGNAGAVYVFDRRGGVWTQQAELTASDAAPRSFFGSAVALAGNRAIVGAWHIGSPSGRAYVFERGGDAWMQEAELEVSDGALFGGSVAASGDAIVVGAPAANQHAGAAYVFTRQQGAWTEDRELISSQSVFPFSSFGRAVALQGAMILVGDPTFSSPGDFENGAVYIFEPGPGCTSGSGN